MSLSQETVRNVMNVLGEHADGITAVELTEVTGLSMPTIREALSTGKTLGMVLKIPGTRPMKYMPVPDTELTETDEPKVIRVPVPVDKPVAVVPFISEIEQRKIKRLAYTPSNRSPDKNIMHAVIDAYESASPTDRQVLLRSMFNIAEYFRQRDFPGKLKPEDVKIK